MPLSKKAMRKKKIRDKRERDRNRKKKLGIVEIQYPTVHPTPKAWLKMEDIEITRYHWCPYPDCPVKFTSQQGLKIHIGKMHKENQIPFQYKSVTIRRPRIIDESDPLRASWRRASEKYYTKNRERILQKQKERNERKVQREESQ